MDEKKIHKYINKLKDKLFLKEDKTKNVSEYAFNTEELENLNKQNKARIKELKQDTLTKKNKDTSKTTEEVLSIIEEEKQEETKAIEVTETTTKDNNNEKSFLNLTEDHQQLVMTKWNEININKIEQDIITAKDLLNHNYTITYADEAARFIHHIRKEYEIVICYLIGFNNEKNGILNKTIFSSKIDDEWKYLNNYIKILEKIRNFKK